MVCTYYLVFGIALAAAALVQLARGAEEDAGLEFIEVVFLRVFENWRHSLVPDFPSCVELE